MGTLSNPFPDGIQEPVGNTLGTMTDVGNSITFFTPQPKAGYNQRWQASVQRQFGASAMVEAAYVGNRGTGLELSRDLNVVGNELLSRSPVFDAERVGYLGANVPNPFLRLPGVNGTINVIGCSGNPVGTCCATTADGTQSSAPTKAAQDSTARRAGIMIR